MHFFDVRLAAARKIKDTFVAGQLIDHLTTPPISEYAASLAIALAENQTDRDLHYFFSRMNKEQVAELNRIGVLEQLGGLIRDEGVMAECVIAGYFPDNKKRFLQLRIRVSCAPL